MKNYAYKMYDSHKYYYWRSISLVLYMHSNICPIVKYLSTVLEVIHRKEYIKYVLYTQQNNVTNTSNRVVNVFMTDDNSSTEKNMSLRFSRNSKTFVLEFLENLKEMFSGVANSKS